MYVYDWRCPVIMNTVLAQSAAFIEAGAVAEAPALAAPAPAAAAPVVAAVGSLAVRNLAWARLGRSRPHS